MQLGPGKLTYMFSAERLRISAPHQASVGRASRRGSGKQKSADVWQKMYTLIYPYPLQFLTDGICQEEVFKMTGSSVSCYNTMMPL